MNMALSSDPIRLLPLALILASSLTNIHVCIAEDEPTANAEQGSRGYIDTNVIDKCWRNNPNWDSSRTDLAMCSTGFAGKMSENQGHDTIMYEVTDSSDDDPANPKNGTLRYGATMISGKVWITFKGNMMIKLKMPLILSNFTTIDGRGADVHIAHGNGLIIDQANDIIIHGLHIYDIKLQTTGLVAAPTGVIQVTDSDSDAIRIMTSKKIWIDHNTFYDCGDGLVDATLGTTGLTISNNWFKDHSAVILLGHDDGYSAEDKNMRTTLMNNHFGPNALQRMPRIRFGYVHCANNWYNGWYQYAVGGSSNPTILSEGNVYTATGEPGHENILIQVNGNDWHIKSVGDVLENGAIFNAEASEEGTDPQYDEQQKFTPADAKDVKSITKDAGALSCKPMALC